MTGCVLVVAIIAGGLLPSPSVITAPIVIQYEPMSVVRSESTGFVDQVHVKPDQMVQAGDVLISLRDEELQTRLIETTSRLDEAKLAAAAQQQQRNISLWQIEQKNIAAIEKQLAETKRSVEQLTLRSPIDGKVLLDSYESLLGTYVMPGQELLSVGNPTSKEAIALVSQSDAGHLEFAANTEVQLRIWGTSDRPTGKVREITPRVRTDLPHFAFAGMYGGPLTVVNRAQYQDSDDVPVESDTSQLVLLEPRIAMHIELDAGTSKTLFSGQTGVVHLRLRTGALGPYLMNRTSKWFSSRIQSTHGL